MGFSRLYDIKILTLYEYEAQMYAFSLKQIDNERDMHVQAWINHQVSATKKQGKKEEPIYKRFEDFFDYEKRVKEVEKGSKVNDISERDKRMARAFKKIGEGGKN